LEVLEYLADLSQAHLGSLSRMKAEEELAILERSLSKDLKKLEEVSRERVP
jgi:hypothetical protein